MDERTLAALDDSKRAVEFQKVAAQSHVAATNSILMRLMARAVGFQGDAAYFSARARQYLFEALGAEPEE